MCVCMCVYMFLCMYMGVHTPVQKKKNNGSQNKIFVSSSCPHKHKKQDKYNYRKQYLATLIFFCVCM